MENIVLVHNLLRWLLLPLIAFVLYRSYVGWLSNKAFEKLDNAIGGAMIGLAHSQLLIGLIIYFSSERGLKLLSTPGVMKDAISRLYALEHPLTMIIAIILLQFGRSFSKKASNDTARFKTIAIYTSIAILLILSRQINWNFI